MASFAPERSILAEIRSATRDVIRGSGRLRAPPAPVRAPAVQSRPMPAVPGYAAPGYRTLLGRVRANVRAYIRKQLELPRQEIAEIVRANLRAAIWVGVAAAFGLAFLIGVVVRVIAVI